MRNSKSQILLALLPSAMMFAGCTTSTAIMDSTKTFVAPVNWQSVEQTRQQPIVKNWLNSFEDAPLIALIERALINNQGYKSQYYSMLLAEQQVTVAGADLLPELSLSAEQARRKVVANDQTSSIANSADVTMQLRYEVDVWGKLSAQQQQANLAYAAAKATFEQQGLSLISQVASKWYSLAQANQLLALYQERAKNLADNLEMMQRSYRLGLNNALDVYLAQNDVSSEQARIAQQKQQVAEVKRELLLLIGTSDETMSLNSVLLPEFNDDIVVGTPSDLLANRPDIQAAWYELLASDAGLAIAHKQRFPSLTLRANVGDDADELGNLLSGNPLAWSLIGGITTPLFNAGRLAAQEEKQRLTVKQKEQTYLQNLYSSFVEVENALSERQSLTERYQHYSNALDNVLAAKKLAFDQYIKGIITYSSVLEAQRRAFDTQTQLIQLKNQLIQNKITLHVALGGSPRELANNFYGALSN